MEKKSNKLDEGIEKEVNDMSKQELRELVMVNTYKLAMARAQIEAMKEILIKKKVTTYEEIWKKTNETFKNSSV